MGAISGVYMIINLDNGKCYIGSSKNIERRFCVHKNRLNKNEHTNIYLQRSWNKHGEDSFRFVILEKAKQGKKLDREQYYIDQYDPEYNILRNVKATPFQKESGCYEKMVKKLRKAHKGTHLSEEHKRKISESNKGKHSGKNNHWYGKSLPKEVKQKISKSLEDREIAKKHREKVSKARKGMEFSEEHKENISKAKIGEKSNSAKLSRQDALKIKKRLKQGEKCNKISKDYPVCSQTISSIKNNKSWSHIELEE